MRPISALGASRLLAIFAAGLGFVLCGDITVQADESAHSGMLWEASPLTGDATIGQPDFKATNPITFRDAKPAMADDPKTWPIKPYFGFDPNMARNQALGGARNPWIHSFNMQGGVVYAVTEKMLGSVGYELQQGQSSFAIGNTPAKLMLKHRGLVLGLSYKLQ
jgi:opacity protein-like surface antigen